MCYTHLSTILHRHLSNWVRTTGPDLFVSMVVQRYATEVCWDREMLCIVGATLKKLWDLELQTGQALC